MASYLTDCLQHEGELAWFIDLLKANEVCSYLEIGSRWGGSFWRIASSLPKGSKVVAVDLPAEQASRDSLRSCAMELQRNGYEVHVVIGNSRSDDVLRSVARLAPFDACLIDGDHSISGVSSDFQNYSEMVSKVVAFHDISWRRAPEWKEGSRIAVPEFWKSIKDEYRYDECCLDPKKKNNGIGVLWL